MEPGLSPDSPAADPHSSSRPAGCLSLESELFISQMRKLRPKEGNNSSETPIPCMSRTKTRLWPGAPKPVPLPQPFVMTACPFLSWGSALLPSGCLWPFLAPPSLPSLTCSDTHSDCIPFLQPVSVAPSGIRISTRDWKRFWLFPTAGQVLEGHRMRMRRQCRQACPLRAHLRPSGAGPNPFSCVWSAASGEQAQGPRGWD